MKAASSGGYVDERLAWLYDQVPAYVSREDVEFFVGEAVACGGGGWRPAPGPKALPSASGSPRAAVLELGCGTGRVLLPTARAGIEITGLDLSEAMLGRLRAKLAAEPEEVQRRVRLVHGDMCGFDLGRRFALITIPFRPFQHLITVEEQMACLTCARRHLADGGRLVFDVFNPDLGKLADPARRTEAEDFSGVRLADGRTARRTHRFVARHQAEQYNDIEMAYYLTDAEGRTERVVHAFPFRHVFRYEMEHLLARCGFRVAKLFGNFDRSPFTDASPQMIFVAEKSEGAQEPERTSKP